MQAKPEDRVVLLRRRDEIQTILDRAVARNEARLTIEHVIDGLVAPIYVRQMLGIAGIDDDLVRTLAKRTISFADEPARRSSLPKRSAKMRSTR